MPIYKGFTAIEPGWVTPWAEQRASGPVWVMSPKDELFFFSKLRAQCCLLLFVLGYIDLFSVPQFPFARWGGGKSVTWIIGLLLLQRGGSFSMLCAQSLEHSCQFGRPARASGSCSGKCYPELPYFPV